jgi:hypothetical protein
VKMRKKMFVFALVTLALLYGSSIAQANLVSGSLWHVSEATAQNAIPANVPATTPDVTFTVNSPLSFDSRTAPNFTVGAWLATGGATSIVENTPNTLTSLMDDTTVTSPLPGNGTTGTLVRFTGFVTVTDPMSFTVGHDDGLTLVINGVDLGFNPGPTAFQSTTQTLTGQSGNLPFELVYGECSGGPAILQIDLPFTNAEVPLPPSALLLGTGIIGLAGLGWRRRKTMV